MPANQSSDFPQKDRAPAKFWPVINNLVVSAISTLGGGAAIHWVLLIQMGLAASVVVAWLAIGSALSWIGAAIAPEHSLISARLNLAAACLALLAAVYAFG